MGAGCLKQRYNIHSFTGGVILGATVALIFTFAVAGLLDYYGSDYWSLISRFVAIPAALIGALMAWNISRLQARHQSTRDLAAWKAVLPLALSDFATAAQNGMLIAAKRHPDQPTNSNEIRKLLSLQATTIQTLQNCIKNSDPITEKWLSLVIAHYQVYVSRSDSMLSTDFANNLGQTSKIHINQEATIIAWAVLYAVVEHHFEYSRGGVDAVPERIDTSRIAIALWKDLLVVAHNTGLNEAISKRVSRYGDGHISNFELY